MIIICNPCPKHITHCFFVLITLGRQSIYSDIYKKLVVFLVCYLQKMVQYAILRPEGTFSRIKPISLCFSADNLAGFIQIYAITPGNSSAVAALIFYG